MLCIGWFLLMLALLALEHNHHVMEITFVRKTLCLLLKLQIYETSLLHFVESYCYRHEHTRPLERLVLDYTLSQGGLTLNKLWLKPHDASI